MATSKTLTPTNVTISIPEMTDRPDASVFSNCADKEADAINALDGNIAKVLDSTTISGSTLAEVQTSLVTLIGGMSDLSVRQIKFTLTTTTGQIEAATYYGKVTRHNSTIAIVEIQSIAADGDNSCIGTWRNSAWSWNRLALNSNTVKYTQTINQSYSNNLTNYAVNIPLPNFEKFASVTIILSHDQDLFGKLARIEFRRTSNYLVGEVVYEKEKSTSYNNFTFDSIPNNISQQIAIKITTGSSLTHRLTADWEYA